MKDYSKPAPYSKRLSELLSDPTIKTAGSSATGVRSVYMIAGSQAWRKAHEIENSHAFLLLPPTEDPSQYDWSLLAGHDPIIVLVEGDASPDEFLALATALDRDGVNRILYPKGDGTAVRHLSNRVLDND